MSIRRDIIAIQKKREREREREREGGGSWENFIGNV